MEWKVSYYNDSVMQNILRLPDTLLAKYLRTVNLIEMFGANLGEPHSKAFGDGLFELRLKGKEGIARVFYCTIIEKKELDIARDRLKEIKDEKK